MLRHDHWIFLAILINYWAKFHFRLWILFLAAAGFTHRCHSSLCFSLILFTGFLLILLMQASLYRVCSSGFCVIIVGLSDVLPLHSAGAVIVLIGFPCFYCSPWFRCNVLYFNGSFWPRSIMIKRVQPILDAFYLLYSKGDNEWNVLLPSEKRERKKKCDELPHQKQNCKGPFLLCSLKQTQAAKNLILYTVMSLVKFLRDDFVKTESRANL